VEAHTAYDRRGHGRSDEPCRGYDFDTFADDVAALIDGLGLTNLTLVGHSMAGCEIVRYLSRHGSGRIARIVLLASVTPMLLRTDDHPNGMPTAAFETLWAHGDCGYANWVADTVAPLFMPETSSAMMRWATNLVSQLSMPIALACSRAMVEGDFRDEMRRIDVPALLIHGDHDRSAPLEATGKPSAALIRNCRLLVYEGAPHGLMYTHMDRLHADVMRFVQETRGVERASPCHRAVEADRCP
jgi:non-heme chloroperoxidase